MNEKSLRRMRVSQVRFAIALAQMDLATATPSEIAELLTTLALTDRVPERAARPIYMGQRALTRKDLRGIQAGFLRVLTEIAGMAPPTTAVKIDLTLALWLCTRPAGDVFVYVEGPPVDRVVYRLVRTLEALGLDNVRRCPAPECGRLFFKLSRKDYCSARCQSRIYMRGYRESTFRQPKERTRR